VVEVNVTVAPELPDPRTVLDPIVLDEFGIELYAKEKRSGLTFVREEEKIPFLAEITEISQTGEMELKFSEPAIVFGKG